VSTWEQVVAAAPEVAARVRERLDGRVSYLATVRADGSPRVHPVTPIVASTELFVFMEPDSPKGRDLRRDGRYALHAGVENANGGGGECVVRGTARLVEAASERKAAVEASSYVPADRYVLFALSVDEAMLTTYGDAGPKRVRWRRDDARD
jgi:nitroimidazol reductase NimA-like FMN-containing flavoprotein (pyridoxamine 5'-phosphate oxidase superfamily)